MNSNNNNKKQTEPKKETKQAKTYKRCLNPFSLDIKDDIYDPFNDNDLFRFDKIKNKFFTDFNNIFTDFGFLPKEKEESKEEKPEEIKPIKPVEDIKMNEINKEENNTMEEEKEEEINTNIKEESKEEGINTNEKEEDINTDIKEEPKEKEINTDKREKEEEINTNKTEERNTDKKEEPKNERICYSKIYCSTYNNINGETNEENYISQSIKQINNKHNISETKELYKNSNGIQKSSYQRGLDGKITRFIKEKNIKTGKNNEKKVIKGIEENEIKDFNKEYNNYSKKFGFRKNIHDLFEPFGLGIKQLNYRNEPMFLHRLLF